MAVGAQRTNEAIAAAFVHKEAKDERRGHVGCSSLVSWANDMAA